MSKASLSDFLGVGLYTVSQAARLAHVPRSTIVRWVFGYEYRTSSAVRHQPAVVMRELSHIDGDAQILSFRDLIEIQFVHAFHQLGVGWPVIRATAAKAMQHFDTDHPFTSQRFLTDGRQIFADVAVGSRKRALVNLLSDQMLFRRMMLPGLRAALEFDGPHVTRWWPLGKHQPIVLDPARQFGQPITEEGVPTQVLSKAFETLRSVDRVARWYEVQKKSVKASVEFERKAA